MPAGYSSLGGQVLNPYAIAVDDKGVPIVTPGGSSAGSGVAVAAGFAAAAIGTETSGSLLSPAGQNGVVTVKPTVGLISRAGIIPIAASQDTAGPMTRTVRDAAILLNVLAGARPARSGDEGAAASIPTTPQSLDPNGLQGARIGVPSDPVRSRQRRLLRFARPRAPPPSWKHAITVLEAAGRHDGARQNIPTDGWIGGPGTDMALLNRNPESPTRTRSPACPSSSSTN